MLRATLDATGFAHGNKSTNYSYSERRMVIKKTNQNIFFQLGGAESGDWNSISLSDITRQRYDLLFARVGTGQFNHTGHHTSGGSMQAMEPIQKSASGQSKGLDH